MRIGTNWLYLWETISALALMMMLGSFSTSHTRIPDGSSNYVEAITKNWLDHFGVELMAHLNDHLQDVIHQLTTPLPPPKGHQSANCARKALAQNSQVAQEPRGNILPSLSQPITSSMPQISISLLTMRSRSLIIGLLSGIVPEEQLEVGVVPLGDLDGISPTQMRTLQWLITSSTRHFPPSRWHLWSRIMGVEPRWPHPKLQDNYEAARGHGTVVVHGFPYYYVEICQRLVQ